MCEQPRPDEPVGVIRSNVMSGTHVLCQISQGMLQVRSWGVEDCSAGDTRVLAANCSDRRPTDPGNSAANMEIHRSTHITTKINEPTSVTWYSIVVWIFIPVRYLPCLYPVSCVTHARRADKMRREMDVQEC